MNKGSLGRLQELKKPEATQLQELGTNGKTPEDLDTLATELTKNKP